MKVQQALILHGTDATPANNWFTWLKGQLEQDGCKVWLPQLPNSDKPNTEIYNKFLLSNSDFEFNEETIIIGHSSGAVEALSLLQHLPASAKVKAVFLVSAFRDDLGWGALAGLFIEPFDFEKIRTKADKFIFIHSDNDPYVPLKHAQYLAEQVGGKLIVESGQGHFNTELSGEYEAFPKLLEFIEKH